MLVRLCKGVDNRYSTSASPLLRPLIRQRHYFGHIAVLDQAFPRGVVGSEADADVVVGFGGFHTEHRHAVPRSTKVR